MAVARISTKGQVVIPKEVRERLGLRTGDRVEFALHKDHAHMQKKDGNTLEAFLDGPKTRWREGELERILQGQYR